MQIRNLKKPGTAFLGFPLAAIGGALVLLGLVSWVLWRESIATEEQRVAELARLLGERTEQIMVDTRDMLDAFNDSSLPRCSAAHHKAMHEAALAKPYIRSIGYWRAADRVCGVGYIQAIDLKPARADRIYDSGVIAWWPSPQTNVGGVQLFLMRYGDHDVAIDPRMLLEPSAVQDRQAGLWVEGLPMARTVSDEDIPVPDTIPVGLTVDQQNSRLVSRFSLGTIFAIDIVAVESIDLFWDRYLPILLAAAGLGLILSAGWIYLVLRYSRHRLSLSTQLREALVKGHIVAFYQPVVELSSGRCVGAEALARWIREDGEMVRPDIFIPIAEQAGLVPEITLAMLAATVRDLGDLLRDNPGLCINLNLASEDLTSDTFMQALTKHLARNALPATCIKLEITERAMVNTEQSRMLIGEFRKLGHQVAIDDFGTGYSSLSYLENFELDTLKIDKSFVDVIGTEAVTNHVIGHVIDMAKSLSLDTVAEGIETVQQASWLIEHGVEYGQGYLFSRPVPGDEFTTFFNAHDEPDHGTARKAGNDERAPDAQSAGA
jgi:sensor c-di-GMP phosphodiesterase-like protein